jgi:acyl-coenzyme A thioesterase PaaI-like protein
MRDRRRLRNHLGSIHAIAIANVAELASGLAMTTALPPHIRGIVTNFQIHYLKKARGTLTAEAHCAVPQISEDSNHDFNSTVTDATGDVVARATVTWRLGPARAATQS